MYQHRRTSAKAIGDENATISNKRRHCTYDMVTLTVSIRTMHMYEHRHGMVRVMISSYARNKGIPGIFVVLEYT